MSKAYDHTCACKSSRVEVQALQNEKDDMVDNFRSTTQILLNRIKDSFVYRDADNSECSRSFGGAGIK